MNKVFKLDTTLNMVSSSLMDQKYTESTLKCNDKGSKNVQSKKNFHYS